MDGWVAGVYRTPAHRRRSGQLSGGVDPLSPAAGGTITAAFYIVDVPKLVHNIYLEQLADLGVPGLVVVLCIFGAAALAALRAAHIFERISDHELELLSRCTILALVAFLSADFFASELVSKQLWIVIALCRRLLALARSQAPSISP